MREISLALLPSPKTNSSEVFVNQPRELLFLRRENETFTDQCLRIVDALLATKKPSQGVGSNMTNNLQNWFLN